jgi:hypothetical protein
MKHPNRRDLQGVDLPVSEKHRKMIIDSQVERLHSRKRHTNHTLIADLLPILKLFEKERPKLDKLDYYKHPYHEKRISHDVTIRWTNYGGDDTVIEITKLLNGRYDHATIQKWINKKGGYGYAKEFTGKGNGFYAGLNTEGKIIKSEWD